LNAQKTNFRQGGGFKDVRSERRPVSGQNRVVSMKHEGSVRGRTSVKKLLPQAMRGI
jgi:hypothetical protein